MSIDIDTMTTFEADKTEEYQREDCAVFRKTANLWGEYSNMAPGFPLVVNGVHILTSEALYQACRFPHLTEVQRVILAQASPMAAKMKGKPHRKNSRPDFDALRVQIMWWTLRVKLACNLDRFGRILLASKDLPIVEDSHNDAFWGARTTDENQRTLVGQNILGRLLALLRGAFRQYGRETLRVVEPLDVKDFLLFGEPIRTAEGKV